MPVTAHTLSDPNYYCAVCAQKRDEAAAQSNLEKSASEQSSAAQVEDTSMIVVVLPLSPLATACTVGIQQSCATSRFAKNMTLASRLVHTSHIIVNMTIDR
jgi:hypothetical protein